MSTTKYPDDTCNGDQYCEKQRSQKNDCQIKDNTLHFSYLRREDLRALGASSLMLSIAALSAVSGSSC